MASKIPKIIVGLLRSGAPKVLLRQKTRSMSTLQPGVKAKMERFGIQDGTRVFKKNGSVDSMTYQMTMRICVASLALIGMNLMRLAFKK